MSAKTKKSRVRKGNSRLTRELLETASDMRASGIMNKATDARITMRHMGSAEPVVEATAASLPNDNSISIELFK
jgi:putative transcriptional regulator